MNWGLKPPINNLYFWVVGFWFHRLGSFPLCPQHDRPPSSVRWPVKICLSFSLSLPQIFSTLPPTRGSRAGSFTSRRPVVPDRAHQMSEKNRASPEIGEVTSPPKDSRAARCHRAARAAAGCDRSAQQWPPRRRCRRWSAHQCLCQRARIRPRWTQSRRVVGRVGCVNCRN